MGLAKKFQCFPQRKSLREQQKSGVKIPNEELKAIMEIHTEFIWIVCTKIIVDYI